MRCVAPVRPRRGNDDEAEERFRKWREGAPTSGGARAPRAGGGGPRTSGRGGLSEPGSPSEVGEASGAVPTGEPEAAVSAVLAPAQSLPEPALGETAGTEAVGAEEAEPPVTAPPPVEPPPTPQPLPKLVDLGADKCIPCKQMAPILEELRVEYAGVFEVVFIDVWKNPAEADRYGIRIIPTQIFYDATGKELFRHVGFYSKEQILAKWRELGVDVGGRQLGPPLRRAQRGDGGVAHRRGGRGPRVGVLSVILSPCHWGAAPGDVRPRPLRGDRCGGNLDGRGPALLELEREVPRLEDRQGGVGRTRHPRWSVPGLRGPVRGNPRQGGGVDARDRGVWDGMSEV
ncbi:MAG TPA: thioredoxin [Candidatus Acetothermia bacterium]|nr:thioredoxin [Candidatus Acetothermia bacterium]